MANYHVNYLTGSDVTGDGGTVNPWATINHALITGPVTTGDVVKVVGSTTTDLTTSATFATTDLTKDITTGIDLTGSLSVGDTVIISPNMSDGAEFNGWMHTQVESITSTVLTTTGYHAYPNALTLAVTITKINDVIPGNNPESITNSQLYVGAVVECGYDATFTSVIGRTYWDNTAVGTGSASGDKFTISYSAPGFNWDNTMPLFRNIGFIRWHFGIVCPTFSPCYANNVVLLFANASPGGTSFYAGPSTDARTLVYINDCDGNVLDKNYYNYALSGDNAPGNMAPLHVFANQNGDRRIERNGGNIKDFTGWGQWGGVFGTAIVFNSSYNLNITGDIVMLGINDTDITSNYYKYPTLSSGTAQITPTSFKLVRNGRTVAETPFNFISNEKDNSVAGNSYVKLPAGESIKNLYLCAAGAEMNANTAMSWQDSEGVWTSLSGTIFFKENLVDQETGNSCLELYTAPGTSYAATKTSPMIAAFPAGNAGLKLTAVAFRYKKISGGANNYNFQTNVGGNYGISFGSQMSFTSTTWATRTLTFSVTSNGYKWVQSCDADTLIPIFANNTSASVNNNNMLIDSITPIYS